jgi:hypothetical protein
MATFLVRALELTAPIPAPAVDYFSDDDASVHEANINKLASLGVTRGCDSAAHLFCPDDPVTRGQMAALLTRAFGYVDDDPTTDRFVDDDTSIFQADIEALAAAGVTKGCNPPANDMYCPSAPVTRAQMAAFITRALMLTPLAPPSVSEAALVRPFFMLDQPGGGPYLAALARYVPMGEDTPAIAVEKLLEGLNTAESSQIPAFSTAVPSGTTLLDLTVSGGVATVDLSGTFDDGGGSFSMLSRLAQLTFTLVEFDSIDSVMLELDGNPVTTFSSEGIEIGGGLDPAFFFDAGVMPEILPTSPAWFEFVESPFTVTGWSRTFEAQWSWALYDNDGAELVTSPILAGSSGPDFGEFSFEITFGVTRNQVGTLTVFDQSAKDGSVIDLRETALWLMP